MKHDYYQQIQDLIPYPFQQIRLERFPKNIAALKNELERTIRKVKTFYEDFIREINFHISSRSRSGMVDTVEELNAKKETAESHIRQVLEIEQEANENRGVAQGIVLATPAASEMALQRFPIIPL